MKVSIITPSYNQGKFIKRTIDSVLNQGIEDLEYIIMDGGSTDSTINVIKEYGNKIIWKSEPDKGQTDAVNKGIKIATGEVIGWLNSDDIYYPEAVKKVISVFEKNPKINVIYGNANHITENDEFIEEYYTEEYNYERLKDVCFICQPSLFFRKSIVDKYGLLDDKLQYCMDYDYWLRIGKEESFYYIKELIAGSRLYDDNKTLGARRKVHEEMLLMQKKNLGKASEKWIYNLAHVIVDEKNIPRIKNEKTNPEFARHLAIETTKIFLKHYKYVPISALKNIKQWYFIK